MFYTIKGLKVKIDNAALTFGGQAWFKGLLPRVEELKIQGMIDHGRSTVAISQVGFLPAIAVAAHIYTNPNPTQIGNWAAQKLTVTGTNNSALKTALLDFTNNVNLVHYWAKIKLNAHPEGAGFKIKVDRGNHNDLDCHYDPDLTKKELVVKVPNNYIKSDPCAILGGILFEAHNARNGQHFRTAITNLKSKGANHINPIERAAKYTAIEADTYLQSCGDYIDIIRKGGHIGPQEWRNIIAVGVKLGFTAYPWVMNGNAIVNFAKSSHNPNLTNLNASTIIGYIPKQIKELKPGLMSGELYNWYKTIKPKPAATISNWKTAIGYPNQLNGSKEQQYFKALYRVLSKTPQSPNVVAWFERWRLPEAIYNMAVGSTLSITDITCPDIPTLKNTVTITPLEFYTAYHV